jgi:hypothetical protein
MGEQWYPMLFPVERGPDSSLREMAALTGGEPTPDPHVTLAYPNLAEVTEEQLARLRELAGPPVPIVADSPYSLTEEPHPLFGHTLSLRVAPHPAFDWWRAVVLAILIPGSLTPSTYQPHLQAVRQMAIPPSEALERLRGRHWRVEFMATTLIVTQRIEDRFVLRSEHRFSL